MTETHIVDPTQLENSAPEPQACSDYLSAFGRPDDDEDQTKTFQIVLELGVGGDP